MAEVTGYVENPGNTSWCRRLMLSTAALGGLLAVDLTSQFVFWKNRPTEVVLDQTGTEMASPRWLALPGLGQDSGKHIADTLHDDLKGPVDYLTLSARGLSARKVGQALSRYYADQYPLGSTKPQNVVANSMGLLTFLMGVEWCLNEGRYVPPVRHLAAISSPFSAAHTYREKHVRLMAKYPYPGGSISKFIVEFMQRQEAQRTGLATIGRSALEAARCSYRDCSPWLWSGQIRVIPRRGDYLGAPFSSVLTTETNIYHFGDPDERTVNITAAWEGIASLAEAHGARFVPVPTPGLGHANLAGLRSYLRSALTLDTGP